MLNSASIWPLLLLLSQVERARPEYNYLPERCKYLIEYDDYLKLQCAGSYPKVAQTKFRDTYIHPGEPMALFMPDSLEVVLAVMKKTELSECEKLRFIDVTTYECIDDDDHNTTVKLKEVAIFCFPFHIQVCDDLMKECFLDKGDNSSKVLDDVLKTKKGVVTYVFDYNNDAAIQQPKLSLATAAVSGLLALLAIF